MKFLSRQFKQILFILGLLFCTAVVSAQVKPARDSREYKSFSKIASKTNVIFDLPEGFKELPVTPDNGDFNYGITIPDQEFQIWLKVIPQTGNAPDSLYVDLGRNEAKALAGENNYMVRGLHDNVLADYNADAGKTYFMNLPDSPDTNHYKFALLITLQKNKKGIIMALCISNDKGPDFFKNINRARNCIKFKASQ